MEFYMLKLSPNLLISWLMESCPIFYSRTNITEEQCAKLIHLYRKKPGKLLLNFALLENDLIKEKATAHIIQAQNEIKNLISKIDMIVI